MKHAIYALCIALATVTVLSSSSADTCEAEQRAARWSASLEAGSTVNGSFASRIVGAFWFPKRLILGENGMGRIRLEVDTGVMDATDTALDIGFQPVLRYQYSLSSSIRPYLDLGAGIHFLSRANINGRQLGAAQQFSLIAGVGLSFSHGIEAGYRYMHLSNADLHHHNDGRDEHLATITFLF